MFWATIIIHRQPYFSASPYTRTPQLRPLVTHRYVVTVLLPEIASCPPPDAQVLNEGSVLERLHLYLPPPCRAISMYPVAATIPSLIVCNYSSIFMYLLPGPLLLPRC